MRVGRVFHLNDILAALRTMSGNLVEERSLFWRGEGTAHNVEN